MMMGFLSVLIFILVGCGPDFKGTYEDPGLNQEMVDDRWNEQDGRETSEKLIKSMISKPWLSQFQQGHGQQKPAVIVNQIRNRTLEHIDTNALSEFIRDELINSQKIRFVNAQGRDEILGEIRYQSDSGMVSSETAKKTGKQIGADFFLSGAISSQVHTQEGVKTVSYQINLILTNLETAEIVWSEKHIVKKRFHRSRFGW